MVHLVDYQQRAIAAEFGQMQVGRRGDALIGGDVAGQAAAGIGRVVGGADREAVAECRAPGRIGEGFLGLQAQAVTRHHPADPVDDAGRDQPRGGDHRQQRLAAAGVTAARMSRASVWPDGDGLRPSRAVPLVGAERAVRRVSWRRSCGRV